MHLVVFSAKAYDRRFFDAANARHGHQLLYLDTRLDHHTARLACGADAISIFVNDRADEGALAMLAECGTRLIALRSAGYNHVDLVAARRLGLTVTHVPDYSPHAVAEHTVALLLSLVRRIPHAYTRVREGNFSIEGLLGFDLHGKTASIVGAGKIGLLVGHILRGFGCRVLAYDPCPSPAARAAEIEFGPLEQVLGEADIVTLHCPLVPDTRHLVSRATLGWFKRGGLLVNTSRGGLLDTPAVIEALQCGRLGGLAIDVYEDEAPLYYEHHSGQGVPDEMFLQLVGMPNVLVTGHQGFFTQEAMAAIATSSIAALNAFAAGESCAHVLAAPEKPCGNAPPAAPHGSAAGFPVR